MALVGIWNHWRKFIHWFALLKNVPASWLQTFSSLCPLQVLLFSIVPKLRQQVFVLLVFRGQFLRDPCNQDCIINPLLAQQIINILIQGFRAAGTQRESLPERVVRLCPQPDRKSTRL